MNYNKFSSLKHLKKQQANRMKLQCLPINLDET